MGRENKHLHEGKKTMTISALIMMTVYLAVVWGLLAIAARHLATTNDETCGTLGDTDLDDMPMYA